MTNDQNEFAPGDVPNHLKKWGSQTIFYAMQVKDRSVGKDPTKEQKHDLMGDVARNEAERLFADCQNGSSHKPADALDYFEAILKWCQEHMLK